MPYVSTLTSQQLQSAVAQLDQALYNHEQWYKSVLRVLVLHLPPEIADLRPDSHERCRFGQWYETLNSTFLNGHPAYISLGRAHEEMHSCARKLLQRLADELPVVAGDFDQFDNVLDKMRLEFHALRQELVDMVQNRDPLTGARTRATLLTELRELHALARREVQPTAIVMMDLDHFKKVNDQYGHPAGDKVLVTLVSCLQGLIRPYDRIYRYGGEEFLISLPGMTADQAHQVAERMRVAVEEEDILIDGGRQKLHITASFGVAQLDPAMPVEDSIERADKALYAAKVAGRNQVK